MKLKLIDAATVISINKLICEEGGNPFGCPDTNKIESILFTAYYPGTPQFQHGSITEISGALGYYLCKSHGFIDGNKRTAALSALTILSANGFELKYPQDDKRDDFSELMIKIASGQIDIHQTKTWFSFHSVKIR